MYNAKGIGEFPSGQRGQTVKQRICSYILKAKKETSSIIKSLTESCRVVRGARTIMRIHSGAAH